MATPPASTMLPFLYQTRTIQRFSQVRPSSSPQGHFVLRCLARHTSTGRSPSWRPSRPLPLHQLQQDHIPFDLPQDLASDPLFNPPQRKQKEKPADFGTITPSERRAFKSIFKEISERSKKQAGTNTADANSREAHTLDGDASPGSEAQGRLFQPAQGRQASEYGRNLVNTIMGDASQDRKQLNLMDQMRQLHNLDTNTRSVKGDMSPEQRYEALLRFPPSLRDAARKALGVVNPPEGLEEREEAETEDSEGGTFIDQVMEHDMETIEGKNAIDDVSPDDGGSGDMSSQILPTTNGDRLSGEIELEKVRYEHRARVEKKMDEAQTDFELWDVLEQEVFPMVEQLGFGPSGEGKPKKRITRRQPKKGTKDGDEAGSNTPRLDINIHGPLYASHLHHALELLKAKFPDSRLAFSILPRVKSLGLVSYVLGVSSDFYTSLMEIHFQRYHDVRAVLDLFEEMRHAGLNFEPRHVFLTQQMLSALRRCAAGELGEFRLQIMAMPEWSSLLETRVLHWTRLVTKDLYERYGSSWMRQNQNQFQQQQPSPAIAKAPSVRSGVPGWLMLPEKA